VGRIGLDLGGTKILGVALDAAPGASPTDCRVPTPKGGDEVVDAMVHAVGLLEVGGTPVERLGVGAAGLVDRSGVLRYGPNLPGIVDLDLATILGRRLSCPVTVDNDATCAMVAEAQVGAARDAAHAVLVTLGTGIGGGMIVDGQPVRGWSGFAGEPGHMCVDPRGPRCPCGQRGCWERFASGSGLARLALDAAAAGRIPHVLQLAGGDPEMVRGEHVTQAAADGDPGALEVMGELGWWVGLGLAALVNILDPEVVVIGGGLSEAGDLLLDPARAALAELVLAPGHRPLPDVLRAATGERAGAWGAALLAGRRSGGQAVS